MASGLYSQHVNNKKMLYLRNTIIILVLVTLAVCCLFPLFYMIVNSFGPAVEAASSNRSVFPTSWSLDSYKAFFSFSEYSVKWLTNTFVVSACQVLGNVVFASLAGYAFAKLNIVSSILQVGTCALTGYGFARFKFKGKNFLFNLILIGMMIPYQVTQVPLYILIVNKFHLSNSYAALVLPGLVTSYNIFLTKQFFSSIPTSLLESAKLDGCSQPKIFTHIVLPLSKTILAVLSINTFLSSWNNFFWPFLVTSKEAMYTIQVGLKQFKFANTTLFGPMMAGATISALPMFILFFCLQKYFLEGVTVGAVKG